MAKTKAYARARKKVPPVVSAKKGPEVPEKKAGPEPASRAARVLRFAERTPGADRGRKATAMQGQVGNARLGRMLRAPAGPSTQLSVVHPQDPSEKEAEVVAQRVAAGKKAVPVTPLAAAQTLSRRAEGEEPVQAQVAAGEGKRPEEAQRQESIPAAALRRQPAEEQEPAARQAGSGVDRPDGAAAARLMARSGEGSPLNPATRSALESGLGADLGAARVHRDEAAHEAAAALQSLPSAVPLLQTMAIELVTGGEYEKVLLLLAILDLADYRELWNKRQIGRIKADAGSDLDALAAMFEDDEIVDDGTVSGRLQTILTITKHLVIPGLKTGLPFGDTGMAKKFQDPWESSRNQVGHFLTAVGLEYEPEAVSRPIPAVLLAHRHYTSLDGTIRALVEVILRRPSPVSDLVEQFLADPTAITVRNLVGASETLSDCDVALRLTIGHELAPDPGIGHAFAIAFAGLAQYHKTGLAETIVRVFVETLVQIRAVIEGFRRQYQAATDEDVLAWNEALQALGTAQELDLETALGTLERIEKTPSGQLRLDPAQRGNSMEDLLLSLVGWRLSELLRSDAFGSRHEVAKWLGINLGPREGR